MLLFFKFDSNRIYFVTYD